MEINPVFISERRDEVRRLSFIWIATAGICGVVCTYLLIFAAARDQKIAELQRRIDACNAKPFHHAQFVDGAVICTAPKFKF